MFETRSLWGSKRKNEGVIFSSSISRIVIIITRSQTGLHKSTSHSRSPILSWPTYHFLHIMIFSTVAINRVFWVIWLTNRVFWVTNRVFWIIYIECFKSCGVDLFHVLRFLQTYSMFSHPGWQDSTICGDLVAAPFCHCHCYDLRSIRVWTSRDDMESLTSWIFNSWRDRNRSRLTNFSMSRPVVFVLLFEFQNSKLFPSLPEIS